MKGTEQPPGEVGGQVGPGRKRGGCGKGKGSPAVGLQPRIWGGQRNPQTSQGTAVGAGGRLGSGRPGPSALPYIYLLVGTPPSAGGVREEAPRLRGAGRQPGLLCTPRHCPPRACAGRAWGETGLVRRGLRWGPRAHPWLLSKKGHPSPSPSPPSSLTPPTLGRGAYGWRTEGCSAGRLGGTATAPTRRGAAGRVKPTPPNAPWTRCPTRPPCG